MAVDEAEGDDLRRANAWHRRRVKVRNLFTDAGVGRCRRGDLDDFLRHGGGDGGQRPHRGDARRRDQRNAEPRPVQRGERDAARRRSRSGAECGGLLKKNLGLFLLIAAVAALGPFSNLSGLFRLFPIGGGFVIITGGIAPSIRSQFALFGVVFVDLLVNYHLPWILAVLIIIGFGVILGWVHGFLVTRMNLQPFVVTLCGLLIYRGVARWYTDDGTAGFEFGQSFPALEWITTGRTYGIPHTFVIFLVVAAIMGVLLHRSVFGRYLFAIGKNEEAARFSGIATKKIIVAAYVICGALAGVSSIFLTMYTRSISR